MDAAGRSKIEVQKNVFNILSDDGEFLKQNKFRIQFISFSNNYNYCHEKLTVSAAGPYKVMSQKVHIRKSFLSPQVLF